MTLKEFFDSKDELAIHCDTKEKAKRLLKAFDKMGKKWFAGNSYLENTYWERYMKDSCYTNCGQVAPKKIFEDVIEFEDIDLGEIKMKVKLRDMEEEQFDKWKMENCKKLRGKLPDYCKNCPFRYVNCSYGFGSWHDRKDLFSDKFLDQEVEIPTPILDDVEREFLQKFIDLFPAKITEIEKYIDSAKKEEFLMLIYTKNNKNGCIHFPRFKMESMYTGMEKLKPYKIEELGLKPKEK